MTPANGRSISMINRSAQAEEREQINDDTITRLRTAEQAETRKDHRKAENENGEEGQRNAGSRLREQRQPRLRNFGEEIEHAPAMCAVHRWSARGSLLLCRTYARPN